MPPFEYYEPFGEIDDRSRLLSFVKDVRWLLDRLVTGDAPQAQQLFPEDIRPLMQEAWTDVQPEFEVVRQELQVAPQEELRKHGLFGPQLKFKLSVITRKFRRFWQQGGREILKWLIEAIDNVLNSILSVIQGGGAIKEIKDGIKHALLD
jgi:hypothetical protein